jgi:glycyl-tRNA synthetase beta chain
MERELLLEIGCEELPARWLTPLRAQLAERLQGRLVEFRLASDAQVESFATPRRLVAVVPRIAERQTDLDETLSGPPVSASFGPGGEPTLAASGFAKKHGVAVADLQRIRTGKGEYLAYVRKQRGKTAVDVLPDVLAGTLRDLTFPKQMRWDAWIDDGRGELLFGRPIRWLLFLYGGRVVPFTIRRTVLAHSPSVQEVRAGAVTYGHRFLSVSGRAGRAVKVRSFADYQARLPEHFVMLDRGERQDRIARELDGHARRLGGRVYASAVAQAGLLQEVADLVEYPAVVAGTFSAEFLDLPEEVLTTTMIHHQHYFPVVDDTGRLMPAFLAVVNIEVDNARKIAVNSERVLTARLRDAQFFWRSDRAAGLQARLDRLGTLLFHKALGSYRDKAERIERLAGWIAAEAFLAGPEAARLAERAARLAKADLTTDMVREFTELQGTMGGIYARVEGEPEAIWKAIYYQYLPAAVEENQPPARAQLGAGAVPWAALSLADKIDSIVGLFGAGERPTGTRDPFAIRRQLHGVLRVLADLPELAGLDVAVDLEALFREAARSGPAGTGYEAELAGFVRDRVKFLFTQRGYAPEEVEAVLGATRAGLSPLDLRRRLESLRALRGSDDFQALAVLFKRVTNIAREVSAQPQREYGTTLDRSRLTEPAELALLEAFDRQAPLMRRALERADYRRAMTEASALRPVVDRFFNEVFVMVEDAGLRASRLMLMVHLRDRILEIADISHLGGDVAPAGAARPRGPAFHPPEA